MAMEKPYVLGVDFGSDSVRALILDIRSGAPVGEATAFYPRWKAGLYCNAARRQFRQHPLDYHEAFTQAVRGACDLVGVEISQQISALSVDTTGSTPCPVDENGTPLALLEEFSQDPDAMFHLWKDHTAVEEAEEITAQFRSGATDYTQFQGSYSSEWFWAKILHTVRRSPAIRARAATWVEHCDYMANLLAGTTALDQMCRCSCAAGHKAYWHSAWGGLPDAACLEALDPYLGKVHRSFLRAPVPCTTVVGTLTPEWAARLGLSTEVCIACGSFDAHAGAVGAGVKAGTMVVNLGTSAVNMLIEKAEHLSGGFSYLAGQAEDSIVPGYVGIETSQAAFGDTYAWLKRLLLWPLAHLPLSWSEEARQEVLAQADAAMLPALQAAAQALPPCSSPVALDWLNGRRYPYNRDDAVSTITGLNLSTDAPMLYQSLVEATAFGQKQIISQLLEHGVTIQNIIAVGGIAQKSDYVMQVLSDVLQFPIQVYPITQACAYGAAIYAAVAAGHFSTIEAAQKTICRPCQRVYRPNAALAAIYNAQYKRYRHLACTMDPILLQDKETT